ncbi:MAG: hypothetical protein S4CHLAM81_11610 [Chlamydiales bacterium]|nr:hypothetical protein [Chlamydiales bacterium]
MEDRELQCANFIFQRSLVQAGRVSYGCSVACKPSRVIPTKDSLVMIYDNRVQIMENRSGECLFDHRGFTRLRWLTDELFTLDEPKILVNAKSGQHLPIVPDLGKVVAKEGYTFLYLSQTHLNIVWIRELQLSIPYPGTMVCSSRNDSRFLLASQGYHGHLTLVDLHHQRKLFSKQLRGQLQRCLILDQGHLLSIVQRDENYLVQCHSLSQRQDRLLASYSECPQVIRYSTNYVLLKTAHQQYTLLSQKSQWQVSEIFSKCDQATLYKGWFIYTKKQFWGMKLRVRDIATKKERSIRLRRPVSLAGERFREVMVVREFLHNRKYSLIYLHVPSAKVLKRVKVEDLSIMQMYPGSLVRYSCNKLEVSVLNQS